MSSSASDLTSFEPPLSPDYSESQILSSPPLAILSPRPPRPSRPPPYLPYPGPLFSDLSSSWPHISRSPSPPYNPPDSPPVTFPNPTNAKERKGGLRPAEKLNLRDSSGPENGQGHGRTSITRFEQEATNNTPSTPKQGAEKPGSSPKLPASAIKKPPSGRFESYKLETDFHDDHVVHRTYAWETASSRRVWRTSTWRRLGIIGSGASGEVWLERGETPTELRAVKQLRRRLKPDFTRELLALVKLREHAHLFVQLFGWYENRDNIFLAMEYIEHGNLAEYIKSQKTLMEYEVKEITKQILEGLSVIHSKGICHRDLKPENILMASKSPTWVKISDFGISKRTKDTFLRTRCGTDGYLAPELLGIFPGRNIYTYALDIWSLGCMVYEMFTSLKPFYELEISGETGMSLYSCIEEPGEQFVIDMASLIGYCKGAIDFPTQSLEKPGVSKEGVMFVTKLLIAVPEDRETAENALKSPWLQGYSDHWLRTLEDEFWKIGVRLDSARKEDLLLREVGKVDIRQCLLNTPEKMLPSLLIKSIRGGYNAAATMLLQSRVHEMLGPTTRRKLFDAVADAGYLETMKLLLRYRMDIDVRISANGETVLGWLLSTERFDMAGILLENQRDKARTVLQAAAETGHTGAVQLLLGKNANVNEPAAENGGRTALQAAAGAGHILIVALLLDSGADVNAAAATESGRTALQAAAEGGHEEIVMLLLEHGADADAEAGSYQGLTALEAASSSRNHLILKFIQESSESTSLNY